MDGEQLGHEVNTGLVTQYRAGEVKPVGAVLSVQSSVPQ